MIDVRRIDPQLYKKLKKGRPFLEMNQDELLHHPEKIRQQIEQFTKENSGTIPDSIVTRDLFIKSSVDQQNIRLHICSPKEGAIGKALLHFHGGGYLFGLPEQSHPMIFQLIDHLKIHVISVDYRLAPQFKFPIPIQDGYDAFQWLIGEGSARLNIDPEHLITQGDSAGGHLAFALSQMAVDQGLEHHIKHQFLLYPVVHNRMDTSSMNEFIDDYETIWNKTFAEISWKHFLGEDRKNECLRYADLYHFDAFHKIPSTTLIACELDPLRDEDIELAEKLYVHQVETELRVIPGATHVFNIFPGKLTRRFYRFLIDKFKRVL